ncbi:MAG: hypothetical protein AWT59_2464, partial [Candidatus Gallionella acididurans]
AQIGQSEIAPKIGTIPGEKMTSSATFWRQHYLLTILRSNFPMSIHPGALMHCGS